MLDGNNKRRDLKQYFHDYEALPFEPVQEKFRRLKVLEFVKLQNYEIILEIGCGRSSLLSEIDKNKHGILIEPIESLLDYALTNLKNFTNLKAFRMTLDEYASMKEITRSDLTIASSILHEVSDPNSFIEDCIKVTKPGGKIIFVVTNSLSIHRILGVSLGIQDSLSSKTLTEIRMQQASGAFSIEELTALFNNFDLTVEILETFFPKLLPHSRMQEALDQGIIDEKFLAQMSQLSDFLPDFGSEIIAVAKTREK